MEHYQKGETITYIPHNQLVTVVHTSKLPGLERPTDTVTIRLKNNDIRSIPVAVQDDFLTRNPPVVRPRMRPVVKAAE